MKQLIWLAIAYAAGIAAILGSLMFMGSLLLWVVPHAWLKADLNRSVRQRLLLNGIALIMAIAGTLLLTLIPFPLV